VNRREKLLEGVTSLNRREFDARKDSEEPPAFVGGGVEEGIDRGDDTPTGASGGGFPADQDDLQGNEGSLEELLRAQVASKSETVRAIGFKISDLAEQMERLNVIRRRIAMEIQIATDVLEANYAVHTTGVGGTEGEVSEEGQKDQGQTDASGGSGNIQEAD